MSNHDTICICSCPTCGALSQAIAEGQGTTYRHVTDAMLRQAEGRGDCCLCYGTGEVGDADGNGQLCSACEGSGNATLRQQAEGKLGRDSMTPKELAKRLKRGERWRPAFDVPGQQAARVDEVMEAIINDLRHSAMVDGYTEDQERFVLAIAERTEAALSAQPAKGIVGEVVAMRDAVGACCDGIQARIAELEAAQPAERQGECEHCGGTGRLVVHAWEHDIEGECGHCKVHQAAPVGVPDAKTEADYEQDEDGNIDTYCQGHMDGWNHMRDLWIAAPQGVE